MPPTSGCLEERPPVQKQVHRIYSYVCVDEFQDTNLSQYRILKHLVNPATRNLFVVADDDQIIYQWNGANPERLNALERDFDMTVLQLPENYRCPPDVIDIANKLISHNLSRASGKAILLAHKPKARSSSIEVQDFGTFDDEADWVANDIAKRPRETRGKSVVLARTRKLLEQVLAALEKHQVPGYLAMRKDEFVSPQISWLHSMLRLANARQDREQLRRVCKSFFALEGIGLNVRDIISAAAAEEGDYLRAWWRAALQREELSVPTRSFLKSAIPRLSDKLDFWSFINESVNWFDELPDIGPESADRVTEFEEEKAIWHGLVNEVVGQYGREQVTLIVLLQELDLRSKTPTPPKNSVPCYTIHASKGMEFDHVYVVGLVEDQLPSWAAVKKGDDSHEMQEERRNCFVAITRAQESLTLTYSRTVFGWKKEPSRFLKEMELVN